MIYLNERKMEKIKGQKSKISQEDVDEMMREAMLKAIESALSPENLQRTIRLVIDKIRGRVY